MIALHAVGELVIKKHEAWWEYFLTENRNLWHHCTLLKIVENSLGEQWCKSSNGLAILEWICFGTHVEEL